MTLENKNIWYKLIQSLKIEKKVGNGPTIPYIIGAYSILDHSYKINPTSIEKLFKDIIDSDQELPAVLQLCPDIKQYVLGIDNREFCLKYFAKEISFSNSANDRTLYITQSARDLGKSIPDIGKNLYYKLSAVLSGNEFSWDDKINSWRQFTTLEIDFIRRIVN